MDTTETSVARDPFADLDDYLAIPRLTGLAAANDGSLLAATVATLASRARPSTPPPGPSIQPETSRRGG